MATITILDFVTRLRTQIRDNGSVQAFPDQMSTAATPQPIPGTSPELQQFLIDAAMEYSRYRGLKKSTTLNMVIGQTVYQLPSDWVRRDIGSWNKAIQPSPLPDPAAYALPWIVVNEPLGAQFNTMTFDWYDDDQQVILGSAPVAAYSLTFDYFAVHVLDETGTTIPQQMQKYVIRLAARDALRALATDYAVKLQKYKVGGRYGIDVDDSKIAALLEAQADKYDAEFQREIVLRPYGTSGGGQDWQ